MALGPRPCVRARCASMHVSAYWSTHRVFHGHERCVSTLAHADTGRVDKVVCRRREFPFFCRRGDMNLNCPSASSAHVCLRSSPCSISDILPRLSQVQTEDSQLLYRNDSVAPYVRNSAKQYLSLLIPSARDAARERLSKMNFVRKSLLSFCKSKMNCRCML